MDTHIQKLALIPDQGGVSPYIFRSHFSQVYSDFIKDIQLLKLYSLKWISTLLPGQ